MENFVVLKSRSTVFTIAWFNQKKVAKFPVHLALRDFQIITSARMLVRNSEFACFHD
jgi:hypothetical protein